MVKFFYYDKYDFRIINKTRDYSSDICTDFVWC